MRLNPDGKKLAVVGSRTFKDKERLYKILTKNRARIKLIISGGAEGADTLAVEWAKEYGVPFLVFPALWRDPETKVYDRGAGFRRNRYIVDEAQVVMAFWDGISRGTKNTIDWAQEAKKPVKIFKFEPPTEFDEWEATKDGLCCSSPICWHQEIPPRIQAILDAKKAKAELEAKRFEKPVEVVKIVGSDEDTLPSPSSQIPKIVSQSTSTEITKPFQEKDNNQKD